MESLLVSLVAAMLAVSAVFGVGFGWPRLRRTIRPGAAPTAGPDRTLSANTRAAAELARPPIRRPVPGHVTPAVPIPEPVEGPWRRSVRVGSGELVQYGPPIAAAIVVVLIALLALTRLVPGDSGSGGVLSVEGTPAPSATNAGGAAVSPGTTGGVGGVEAAAPASAIAALRQAAALRPRLLDDIAAVRTALTPDTVDTGAMAAALRGLAEDARIGSELTARLAGWAAADELRRQLDAFFAAIAEAGREGLDAALSNESAYRAAGERSVAVFARLEALDVLMLDLAGRAGLALPIPTPPTPAPSASAIPSGSPALP